MSGSWRTQSDPGGPGWALSRERARSRWMAGAGIVAISFIAILFRLAAVSPSTAAFYRSLYALPVLWLVSRRFEAPDRSRGARWLARAAGAFLGLDLVLWHHAIELIGAGLATVLVNTQVIFVGLLAWAVHGERPPARALLVIPAILAGVVLISGFGGAGAYGDDPAHGALAGLLAGLAYSLFLLLLRAANRGARNPVGALTDATLGAAAASFLALVMAGGPIPLPTWPAHGWLVLMGLGGHTVGWLLISTALPRLPALETSVLLLLQPVLTMLWAALAFGEWIAPLQWAGVATVLGGLGVLSARRGPRRAEEHAEASA